ncbi:MAG: hypothetical protein ACI8UR_001166 [Natronomonas sp.]|jgi:hypothetical protein|uniref:hypothetical protein n=1 Tax=Natronomonas sp. TaxID=2184060 RepID=UPI0039E5865D
MNQQANSAAGTASVPPTSERVSLTDEGAVVVTVPATVVRVAALLALLVGLAFVASVVIGTSSVVGTFPLGLLVVPLLVAAALASPFAALALVATRLE